MDNLSNKKAGISLVSISIVLSLLYAYSRLSWSFILPSIVWAGGMAISIGLLLVSFISKNGLRIQKDVSLAILAIMIIIIALNNNYDIKAYGLLESMFPYIGFFCIYLVCGTNGKWVDVAIKFMIILGGIYVLFTLLCNINTNFYYSYVFPLMSKHYTTTYTPHPSAGFTAHYSTNGIYIAMMYCAIMGKTFFAKGEKVSKAKWMLWLLTVISVLICGKRGIILALIIATFLTYLAFTVNKKRGKYVKLFVGVIVLLILIEIASFFIPSVNYTISRFSQLNFSEDIGTSNRLLFWKYSWDAFLEKPFLGHGWRWFKFNNPISKVDVHNCFLQLLTENGILGAIPFYMFFLISIYRAWRLSIDVKKKKNNLSCSEVGNIYMAFLGELFMVIYMFEGTALYMPECMFSFFVYCAIVEVQRKKYVFMK